jgi:mono/diheme cytochrome c family protein
VSIAAASSFLDSPSHRARLRDPPLDKVRDLDAAIATVTNGRNNMPPFRSAFTPEQIRDVSVYVVEALARVNR